MACEPPRQIRIVVLPGGGRRTVCWIDPDGREGRGSPLAASAAEEMLAVYRRLHPDRTFWLEEEALL
jgi:hypothetical protein